MATTQNIGLFGTRTRTYTLLVVHMLGESHASEIAKILGKSVSRIQAAIDSLERAGVLVGTMEGSARRITISPRFPAADELRALLSKMSLSEKEIQKRLGELRRRPRRSGKAL